MMEIMMAAWEIEKAIKDMTTEEKQKRIEDWANRNDTLFDQVKEDPTLMIPFEEGNPEHEFWGGVVSLVLLEYRDFKDILKGFTQMYGPTVAAEMLMKGIAYKVMNYMKQDNPLAEPLKFTPEFIESIKEATADRNAHQAHRDDDGA
jgi:hypothetical protein